MFSWGNVNMMLKVDQGPKCTWLTSPVWPAGHQLRILAAVDLQGLNGRSNLASIDWPTE